MSGPRNVKASIRQGLFAASILALLSPAVAHSEGKRDSSTQETAAVNQAKSELKKIGVVQIADFDTCLNRIIQDSVHGDKIEQHAYCISGLQVFTNAARSDYEIRGFSLRMSITELANNPDCNFAERINYGGAIAIDCYTFNKATTDYRDGRIRIVFELSPMFIHLLQIELEVCGPSQLLEHSDFVKSLRQRFGEIRSFSQDEIVFKSRSNAGVLVKTRKFEPCDDGLVDMILIDLSKSDSDSGLVGKLNAISKTFTAGTQPTPHF